MSRKTISTTIRWLAAAALALAGIFGPFAAVSGAASPIVTSSSSLAPGLVTSGLKTLYGASWTNQANATLTNTLVVITLPAGSSVLSANPNVCTTAQASPADPVVVSCRRENLSSGATLTQQLLVRVSVVAVQAQPLVSALLKGDEKTSDADKSHTDSFAAPDQLLTIVPTSADAAGSCLQAGDSLSTQPGLSSANPLITAARLTGPTGLFCAPLTVVEQHRTNPTEGCPAGTTCSIGISVTEAPAATSPYLLTFTFVASNKNLTWYKNGEPVPDCVGATQLPTGLAACVTSRSKSGSASVTLGVLWHGGPDPSWTG